MGCHNPKRVTSDTMEADPIACKGFLVSYGFCTSKVINLIKTMVINDGATRLPSILPLPLNGFRVYMLGVTSLSRNKEDYSDITITRRQDTRRISRFHCFYIV